MSASFGATAMTPKCGRTGTRMPLRTVEILSTVRDRPARLGSRCRVHHALRIGLRRPAIVIDRLGPIAFASAVDLVNGDDLTRLWLGQQVMIVIAPIGGGVATEGASSIMRQPRGSWLDVKNAHLKHIAWLGAPDENRTGADMHAQPAAPRFGARAAAVDGLMIMCPVEDTFRPGVAIHHALRVIISVVRQYFDRGVVAGTERDLGRKIFAE